MAEEEKNDTQGSGYMTFRIPKLKMPAIPAVFWPCFVACLASHILTAAALVLRDNISGGDDHRERLSLEKWVKANAPDDYAERAKVAESFSLVARRLAEGRLVGKQDAYADIVAETQPVCTQEKWAGFFGGLERRLKDEEGDLASSFNTIALALRGREAESICIQKGVGLDCRAVQAADVDPPRSTDRGPGIDPEGTSEKAEDQKVDPQPSETVSGSGATNEKPAKEVKTQPQKAAQSCGSSCSPYYPFRLF